MNAPVADTGLPPKFFKTPQWKLLRTYIDGRIEELRTQLEAFPSSEAGAVDRTPITRGRIAELRQLLTLAETAASESAEATQPGFDPDRGAEDWPSVGRTTDPR